VYSQSLLSPSKRYWSAARRRSWAMSRVISTDPVYINLEKRLKTIRIKLFTIITSFHSTTFIKHVNAEFIWPHHQLKNLPSNVWNLYVPCLLLLTYNNRLAYHNYCAEIWNVILYCYCWEWEEKKTRDIIESVNLHSRDCYYIIRLRNELLDTSILIA